MPLFSSRIGFSIPTFQLVDVYRFLLTRVLAITYCSRSSYFDARKSPHENEHALGKIQTRIIDF